MDCNGAICRRLGPLIYAYNGNAIAEYVYRPFGETWLEAGARFRYLYTGQEQDFETGLYFYNARYYDARLARFTQPDTIVPGAFDPQALNRYSYALNNPLRYTDPTGNESVPIDNRCNPYIFGPKSGCFMF